MSSEDVHGITTEVRRLVSVVQGEDVSARLTKVQLIDLIDRIRGNEIGPIVNYMLQIDALVDDQPSPSPTPSPPTAQFLPPIQQGVQVIFGRTKWLPQSLGADFFCEEGTELHAPCDCIVEEVIPGQGISGGAEIIFATADKMYAWRWRHVQAVTGINVGVRASQGQTLAVVRDRSLDQLGNIPAWAIQAAGGLWTPSRWQHLDLSYNTRTDQFAPTGGGGGNGDADQWAVSVGLQGIEIDRTPGPPDAGFGLAEAIKLMMPARLHR